MPVNWLDALARASLGDFEVTPELDRDLSRRALLARHDSIEREALFGLLAFKVRRFALRYRGWNLGPWDLEDVEQEAYLVYIDTLRVWTPSEVGGEPAGYLCYFLSVFPHWLMNAVRAWTWPGARTVTLLPDERRAVAKAADHSMVDDFCERLEPDEASLLRLRLVTGASLPDAAESMGIARRTAYRRWRHIVELGREYLREAV